MLNWRNLAARLVPFRIGRLPYVFALFTVNQVMRVTGKVRPSIWPRHSYALGTLMPFLSDLDLTFWFEQRPMRTDVGKIYKTFHLLKKLIPLLGEDNCYVASEVDQFIGFANTYEISRDPVLLKKLRLKPPKARPGEAAAFLVRNIESDLTHLRGNPLIRAGKWRNHLDFVGEALSGTPSVHLLTEAAVRAAGLRERGAEEAIASLEGYFSERYDGVLSANMKVDKYSFSFFPHRLRFYPEVLDSALAQIAAIQLEWEIWGLYSQCRRTQLFLDPDRQFLNYVASLENILRLNLSSLPRMDQERLGMGFGRFRAVYEGLHR